MKASYDKLNFFERYSGTFFPLRGDYLNSVLVTPVNAKKSSAKYYAETNPQMPNHVLIAKVKEEENGNVGFEEIRITKESFAELYEIVGIEPHSRQMESFDLKEMEESFQLYSSRRHDLGYIPLQACDFTFSIVPDASWLCKIEIKLPAEQFQQKFGFAPKENTALYLDGDENLLVHKEYPYNQQVEIAEKEIPFTSFEFDYIKQVGSLTFETEQILQQERKLTAPLSFPLDKDMTEQYKQELHAQKNRIHVQIADANQQYAKCVETALTQAERVKEQIKSQGNPALSHKKKPIKSRNTERSVNSHDR